MLQIVSFLLKLARMYHKSHRDADAERLYGRCVDLQLPKASSGSLVDATTGALCVSALFWFGDFLAQNGRNSEAAQRLEQAYDVAARVPCVTPEQVMVILYSLAEVACTLPDYDAALRSVQVRDLCNVWRILNFHNGMLKAKKSLLGSLLRLK